VSEAYLECSDADRDEYLYYILAKHPGRTIVFVNAVSALRRVAAILQILGLPAHALHAQQQQRQRLKVRGRRWVLLLSGCSWPMPCRAVFAQQQGCLWCG
jgi:ATP-dependent RNA helicase DDX24/MAK5